jgi:hypothetical protein
VIVYYSHRHVAVRFTVPYSWFIPTIVKE